MKVIIFGITLMSLIGISAQLSAQSVKRKGFLVLNNGDSLHGWINYYNWERNPSTVSFLKDSTGSATNYSKYDIKAVEINGYDRYIKAVVEKDARPVNLEGLLPANIDSIVTDTALLRLLVKGSVFDLYELVDNKNHFFISAERGGLRELIYKVVAMNNNTYSEQKTYINQIKSYLTESGIDNSLLKRINTADYNDKDLTFIVGEMNKISGTVEYTSKQNKKILTSFFAGVGVGYSNLKFSGTNSTFRNMHFGSSFIPFATIGMEISSPRSLQAVALRLEVDASHAAYQGEYKQTSSTTSYSNTIAYSITQTNISPSFSLLFNFIRKESFKIYAGTGVAWNIAFYGKNQYTEVTSSGYNKKIDNYLDLPKTWIGFPLFKLGTKLGNKLSAELDGRFWGSMTHYSAWSLTPQTITAQVRYYF